MSETIKTILFGVITILIMFIFMTGLYYASIEKQRRIDRCVADGSSRCLCESAVSRKCTY